MRSLIRLGYLLILVSLLVLVAACGPTELDPAATPAPEGLYGRTPPAGLPPATVGISTAVPPVSPSPTEAAGGETAEAGAEAQMQLTAENIAFDKDTITVPAGSHVVVEFTNNDSVPHNFAVYASESADEEIFVGERITGPNETVTYEFDAPSEPGDYFFRCDVHPQQMTGQFVVE